MTKSLANKLRLKERLYIIRMAEGTFIQSHLNEFKSICVDLKSLDVKIDDEDKAILLVVSLPPLLSILRKLCFMKKHTLLVFENVKSNLLSKKNLMLILVLSLRVKVLLFEVELNKRAVLINQNQDLSKEIVNPTIFVVIAKLIIM
jgi:hypothetical protein